MFALQAGQWLESQKQMKTRKLFLCLAEAKFEVGMMGVGERPLKQVNTEMIQEKEILERGW